MRCQTRDAGGCRLTSRLRTRRRTRPKCSFVTLPKTDHDLVLVVDFGAQYAQLIARRVREARVYSELVPHTMPIEEMLARNPKAIILSGGPSSVYADGAPGISDEVFTAGVPVFGMCYGFQLMAQGLGGEGYTAGAREDGRTPVRVSAPGTLLDRKSTRLNSSH